MARPRKLGYGEGSVYFDKSKGVWRGAVTIEGVRRRVSGLTRSEALRALDELRSELANAIPAGDDTRLSVWIDWWTTNVGAARSDPSEATEYNYRWALAQAAPIGGKRLRDLRTADVERLLHQLATRKPTSRKGRGRSSGPLGRSSLKRIRAALAEVLNEAVRREMIGRNVAKLAKLPREARPPTPRRSLSPREAEALLEAARADGQEALIATMLFCGLRPGEVTGLTWSCVDFSNRTITVRQSRKVLPDGTMVIGNTKAHSDRVQRMPERLAEVLKAHQVDQKRARLAAPAWEEHGLVFPNAIGRHIDPSNLRRDIARLCKDAGVEPITPNELRHSAASLLVNAGVPLEEVADFLGHVDVTMLAQVYRHRIKRVVDITAAQERMLAAD